MKLSLRRKLCLLTTIILTQSTDLRGDDYPNTLPIGGFKIVTPDGPKYIPDIVVHESALLLDFENAESPVVGKLELSLSLGDETFHRNFEQLNTKRASNSLPELQLQPLVAVQIAADLPNTIDPLASTLLAATHDVQSIEIDLNSEQVVLLHSLHQQAGWMPQLTVKALINGDYRSIARLEPLRHHAIRKAFARTLRVLPPSGFSDQNVRLKLTQQDHGINQVKMLTQSGVDFSNLNAAKTVIECEFAATSGFLNHFQFDFDRWPDERLATATVPIEIRSAIIPIDLLTSAPTSAVQFMGMVFDSDGRSQLFFVDRPTNGDQAVNVMTVQGAAIKDGCVLGFDINGELVQLLKLLVPSDLGTPSFRLMANGLDHDLLAFLRDKFNDRYVRTICPNANEIARQALYGIADKLKILDNDLQPILTTLKKGDRGALLKYSDRLNALRGRAAIAVHEGFAGCCIASSIAYDFGEFTTEEHQVALNSIHAHLGTDLAASDPQVRNLLQEYFNQLIARCRDAFGSSPVTLETNSTPSAILLRTCFSKFPFLRDSLTESDKRYVVGAVLVQSNLDEDILRGIDLLQKNLHVEHLLSIDLLASLLISGKSTITSDFPSAVTVCKKGISIGSAACNRLLGMLHRKKLIVGAELLSAITLLEKAAELEDREAMIQLGYIFLDMEPPYDSDKALEWFSNAADKEPEAMLQSGLILQRRNAPEYLAIFRRAAESGYASGQYHYALALMNKAPKEEVTKLMRASAMQGFDPAAIEYARLVAEDLTDRCRVLFESDTSATEVSQQLNAMNVAKAIYSVRGPKATTDFIGNLPSQAIRDRVLLDFSSTFSQTSLVNERNLQYNQILQFATLVNDSTRIEFEIGIFQAMMKEGKLAEAFSFEQDKNISGRFPPDDFQFRLQGFIGRFISENRFDDAIRLNKLFGDVDARENGWEQIIHGLIEKSHTDRASDLLANNASALTRDKFAAVAIRDKFFQGNLSDAEAIQQVNALSVLPLDGKRELFAIMAEQAFVAQFSLEVVRALLREAISLHGAAFRITEALAKAKKFDDALMVARDIPDVDSTLANRDKPRREALAAVVYQLAMHEEFKRAKELADEFPATISHTGGFFEPIDRAALYSSIARVELKSGKKQQSIETLRSLKAILATDNERAMREFDMFASTIPTTGDTILLNEFWQEFLTLDNQKKAYLLMLTHAAARRYTEAATVLTTISAENAWGARIALCNVQFENGDYDACRSSLTNLPTLDATGPVGITFDQRDRVIDTMVKRLLSKNEHEIAMTFIELMGKGPNKIECLRSVYKSLKDLQQSPSSFAILHSIELMLLDSDSVISREEKRSAMPLLLEQARSSWNRGDYDTLLLVIDEFARVALTAENESALSKDEKLNIVWLVVEHLETLRKQERTFGDFFESLTER